MKTKFMATRLAALVAGLMASAGAMANTTGTNGSNVTGQAAFDGFKNTVMSWARGPLGTGLAVTMMLMGAGMGVAKNSPMPALSGIAGAAFLNWGPGIIEGLTGGALI